MTKTIYQEARAAYGIHKDQAVKAWDLYCAHCEGHPPPRVPGMDTIIRLAVRISHGKTIEEAAAAEYIYRWSLAIKAPGQCIGAATRAPCISIFGTPHLIGM